ncbi:YbaK/EbsC family protein, partial [Patescibacteria group bacterium]|nr:YbaK/EbsC family protein [Patescibacteria group bacterium]
KKVLNVKKISIANENVMQKVFNVKPGAITPFGSIHKTQVVIDRSLLKSPRVLMGSGSFSESVAIKVKDFVKLEEPIEGVFGKRFTSDVIAKPKQAKKTKVAKKKKAVKKSSTKRKTKKKK